VVDCEEPHVDLKLVRIFEAGSVLTAAKGLPQVPKGCILVYELLKSQAGGLMP